MISFSTRIINTNLHEDLGNDFRHHLYHMLANEAKNENTKHNHTDRKKDEQTRTYQIPSFIRTKNAGDFTSTSGSTRILIRKNVHSDGVGFLTSPVRGELATIDDVVGVGMRLIPLVPSLVLTVSDGTDSGRTAVEDTTLGVCGRDGVGE